MNVGSAALEQVPSKLWTELKNPEKQNHALLVSGLLVTAMIFWLFKEILNMLVNMLFGFVFFSYKMFPASLFLLELYIGPH